MLFLITYNKFLKERLYGREKSNTENCCIGLRKFKHGMFLSGNFLGKLFSILQFFFKCNKKCNKEKFAEEIFGGECSLGVVCLAISF